MSHPAQFSEAPGGPPGPRTQEMPAVPPPPTGTADLPATAPAVAIPVESSAAAPEEPLVPGFDGPPVAEPTSRRRWSYGPRLRAAAIGVGLVVLAFLLLQWGLAIGRDDLWETSLLWSAFATVCTLVALAAFAPDAPGRAPLARRTGWRIAVAAVCGFVVFWALVVLPQVAGDRGFLITAALASLAAAVWTGPHRNRPRA